MKISQIGEFGLIDAIRKLNPVKDKDVIAGIGDDAAVIRDRAGGCILMTTDTLVENVHYNPRYFTFYELGWKLAAANISDIAAMGGVPKYALVTLGLKAGTDISDIRDFYAGMRALAGRSKVEIVGGDIVRSPKSSFFTMHLLGSADKVVKRSGARPGDAVVVIGRLGGSAAGLASLKKYGRKAMKIDRSNVKAHLMPRPMVKEGRAVSAHATSMIDNSDGLARCLIEICRSSKVGAKIELDKVPIAKGATLKQALDGGEDYNLILTVPKSKVKSIKNGTLIGEVMKAKKIVLTDSYGKKMTMEDKGYEQF